MIKIFILALVVLALMNAAIAQQDKLGKTDKGAPPKTVVKKKVKAVKTGAVE